MTTRYRVPRYLYYYEQEATRPRTANETEETNSSSSSSIKSIISIISSRLKIIRQKESRANHLHYFSKLHHAHIYTQTHTIIFV